MGGGCGRPRRRPPGRRGRPRPGWSSGTRSARVTSSASLSLGAIPTAGRQGARCGAAFSRSSMVTYRAVARVSKSASTGPPGSTLGSQRRSGHPRPPPTPLGIDRLVGDACRPAAVAILDPSLGQVQLPVDHGVPVSLAYTPRRRPGRSRRGRRCRCTGAAPHRGGALLEVAGLVHHQHHLEVAERLDQVGAHERPGPSAAPPGRTGPRPDPATPLALPASGQGQPPGCGRRPPSELRLSSQQRIINGGRPRLLPGPASPDQPGNDLRLEYWPLTSAYGSWVMARSSAGALRRTRMFISTNHRVITVGKMMVRILVTVVGSPAAWIRPRTMAR
jgi:hypothetical protein